MGEAEVFLVSLEGVGEGAEKGGDVWCVCDAEYARYVFVHGLHQKLALVCCFVYSDSDLLVHGFNR